MEGSYSKVWNAREEAPAEEYKFFVDSLMGTIRCVLIAESYWLFSLTMGIGTRSQAVKRQRMKDCH